MSYGADGKGSKSPTIQDLQAEIKRLNEKAAEVAKKFELKERFTRVILQKTPRHILFGARWAIAEALTLPEIDLVIEYLKGVLPDQKEMLDAYKPDFVAHRESLDMKAKIDTELAEAKAKEPAPIKAPALDVKPARIGTDD